ncbi:MAG: hypothetical protein M3O70_06675 [Actinomycetota bacterium]|nr:hypothetical protein [Actinomycetota bacterium]
MTSETDASDDVSESAYRRQRLRETYQEVLAAMKHEDDKVGRFLTAIAFLVAGALIFVKPESSLPATI